MTNEHAHRIAAAAILDAEARQALAESERLGQREQARADRLALTNAQRALAALVAEAQR